MKSIALAQNMEHNYHTMDTHGTLPQKHKMISFMEEKK